MTKKGAVITILLLILIIVAIAVVRIDIVCKRVNIIYKNESFEEVQAEKVELTQIYNIPLDCDTQQFVIEKAKSVGISPEYIFAMMKVESNFTPDVVGDNGRSVGLMQIQSRWHQDTMNQCGVTDLCDPVQNATVGIAILKQLVDRGNGLTWAFNAYNGGAAKATQIAESGQVGTYAEKVYQAKNEIHSKMIFKEV